MALQLQNCPLCGEQVSPLGSYVREAGKLFHISCYLKPRIETAIAARDAERLEAEQDKRRAEQDREAAKREELQASLLKLKAKGKALWTRADRQKLVEAKLICVHCGERPPTIGNHCSPCYTASQYGEAQAAAASAKSAQGISDVEKILAGPGPKAPPPAPLCSTPECNRTPVKGETKCDVCKASEKPRDRFAVIEIDT